MFNEYIKNQSMQTIKTNTEKEAYSVQQELKGYGVPAIRGIDSHGKNKVTAWCEYIRWKFIREDLKRKGYEIQ